MASDHPEVFLDLIIDKALEENPAPVKATAIEVKNHAKRAASRVIEETIYSEAAGSGAQTDESFAPREGSVNKVGVG